jgi:hypothetical protein
MDSQPNLPPLTLYDWVMTAVVTFVVCWLLLPGAQWAGERLNWANPTPSSEIDRKAEKAASAS